MSEEYTPVTWADPIFEVGDKVRAVNTYMHLIRECEIYTVQEYHPRFEDIGFTFEALVTVSVTDYQGKPRRITAKAWRFRKVAT